MTIQNVSGHKHKGHMQSETFYTFPRPVMEDQNHNKTIQCGQCIKGCGCPDHHSNKVCDCKPYLLIFVDMP